MLYFKYLAVFLVTLLDAKKASAALKEKPFVTLHQWTFLNMTFPTNALLKAALKSGLYDGNKPLPVDVDIEYGDNGYHRTFLTIPRLNPGVPYSLATIADADIDTVHNPAVTAYPSYEWHADNGLNCTGITSAMRTFIDDCWRLWVVDSGQINSLQYCAPQILAFDLVADKLVHRYTLPASLYKAGVSVFTALAVDIVGEECSAPMIYIADPWAYGLIVYDALAKRSWRIEHEFMRPERNLQKLNLANDGIFTVSISPRLPTANKTKEDRFLYFHALNSYKEVRVPLGVVNNATLWRRNRLPPPIVDQTLKVVDRSFVVIGDRGTQCESEAMDRAGNLYCSLMSSNAVISWSQSYADYNSDRLKVVAYSPAQIKFVTGLKVNRNTAEEDELWALSNDPKLFVGGTVKPGNVKFQVVGCRTKNLLENDDCSVGAKEPKRSDSIVT